MHATVLCIFAKPAGTRKRGRGITLNHMSDDLIFRAAVLSILLAGGIMTGHYRGKANRVGGQVPRRVDGPAFLIPQTIFGLAGLLGLLAYLAFPPSMSWAKLAIPPGVRLLGLPVGGLALALFYWMFRHLGDNITATSATRPKHVLVTSGPYRWVRHPMYSTGTIFLVAYSLLTANWFIAAMFAGCGIVVVARIGREEANLLRTFGDEYQAYRNRTGRLLPKLRRP